MKPVLILFIAIILTCAVVLPTAAQEQTTPRLSSGEADKLLLKAPEAKYPNIVGPVRPQGIVIIEATISQTGVVTSAEAIEGHPFLFNAAVTAVRKYKYKPHTIGGKPVSFTTEVYVGFPPDLLSGNQKEEFDRQRQLARQYFRVEPECKKFSQGDNNWKEIEEACRNLVRIADQLSPNATLERMGAYETLGRALARQERYEEALDWFNRAFIPVKSMTEHEAILGRLYGNVAATHHLMGDLEKARKFYRRAEKVFQTAYEDAANVRPKDFSDELKTGYAQQLRRLLQSHLKAAEESGATAEVAEIQQLLKTYQ